MHVRFAQIEPTTRCNYTCGFCVGRTMPQEDMSLDTFRQFINQAEGLEAIELQGEGEPLLHPNFFDMIRLAREKFPDVEISMITNGSMFTAEIVEAILDARIARIFVSVESVEDSEFQRIRGGKLARVRRGIEHLLNRRTARGLTHPLVGLSVTVLKSTAWELPENIPAFYNLLGLDGGISFQLLQPMDQYRAVYDEATTQELIDHDTLKSLDQAIRQSGELDAVLRQRAQNGETGFYERLYRSVDTRLHCPWLHNGAYVSTQGAIMPCCHTKDYARDAIGKVGDNARSLSDTRKAMQSTLHKGRSPEACKGCPTAERVLHHVRMLQARTPQRL